MQSQQYTRRIQAFICYDLDDYGRSFEYCEKNCRLKVSNSNWLINPKHLHRVLELLNGL